MGLLSGKVGIVTGAGRGIGAAIALEMARQGAAVVVNDLGAGLDGSEGGESPAEAIVQQIRDAGGQAIANLRSVAEFAGAQSMVHDALRQWGQLDFAVHNAGIVRDVIFHRMTEADFDAVIAVHLKGGFNLFRACTDQFKDQGHGALVAMTSTSGLIGSVGQANYAAAKLGLVALTKSVALDMQRYGVRANAVAPFAWTRMTASIPAKDPAAQARLARLQQLDPAQVAPLVAVLCSDSAKDVNGQVFAVRGSEITLFEPMRPTRSLHRNGGWTSADLAESLPAAFRGSFAPLQVTSDVFGYEPLN